MSRRFVITLVTAALVLASAIIVVLALQQRSLKREIAECRTRMRTLHRGAFVPAVRVPTIEGDTVILGQSPSGAPQLLLVLTTTCPYCKASLPHWQKLAPEAQDLGAQVFAVSLDAAAATDAYRDEHQLDLPFVILERWKDKVLYRAWSVPQTAVLDADGRVVHVTLGVFDRPQARDSVLAALRTLAASVAVAGGSR